MKTTLKSFGESAAKRAPALMAALAFLVAANNNTFAGELAKQDPQAQTAAATLKEKSIENGRKISNAINNSVGKECIFVVINMGTEKGLNPEIVKSVITKKLNEAANWQTSEETLPITFVVLEGSNPRGTALLYAINGETILNKEEKSDTLGLMESVETAPKAAKKFQQFGFKSKKAPATESKLAAN